jgi:DedD protein
MLFGKGTESGKRPPTRNGGSSEAQLKALRSKARRRLIGALALVLAAVIVVPWLFEEPVTDDTAHQAPIVIPTPPQGLPPAPEPAAAVADATPAEGTVQAADPAAASAAGTPASVPQATGQVAGVTPAAPEPSAPDASAGKPKPEPARTEPKPASKPSTPHTITERTDDGSVALALLAGKAPPAASAAAAPAPAASSGQGRYYLQVAAYASEQDAQSRRNGLQQAGITDAYVERGQSGGKTVYRLRVGPFGSHEAAQAAQARLRALGYQNGLISGK